MLFVFLFECAAANFNKRIGYMEKEKISTSSDQPVMSIMGRLHVFDQYKP